ncbi:Hypothetical protein DHA2_152058 [Giardia duodenalis]|uniref:Uncharacterized protein n=1 Tax=Giardia intestinalis TaxID=5741 RepID=V6TBC2_GIAIN|nr:Hypothetical protein DHA2_152058 [Giardia intestinalis]
MLGFQPSGCSLEDQQVYDRCSQYLSKLLDFGTVFTTQEFSELALSISRSDLTIILSKDSPLLVHALKYVRLVLMYHKIHVNMTFLLARMLSLISSLKGAPEQYVTALDLTIDNLYLLLVSSESRDQLVNSRSFIDRCDAATTENPSIFGVTVDPYQIVSDFVTFIKETEYFTSTSVRNLAFKAANFLLSYIVAPYFDHEASERARVKVGSCRYVTSRAHEAENHLYLMSFLFNAMQGSRLVTHLVYQILSYTPVVGLYNDALPHPSRGSSYGKLGLLGQEYRAPMNGGSYTDSHVAGCPIPPRVPTIPAPSNQTQLIRSSQVSSTAPDALKLPQFYLQMSSRSSRTHNCTSAHIPPVTVKNLVFYPFLSCFTECFVFCSSCQSRLLPTAYKDKSEANVQASRERIFTCDRCYSSSLLEQLFTGLLKALELNSSRGKEVISYNDIIALFGYIFVCHQALLTYTRSKMLLGTSCRQIHLNLRHKLLQTRRLATSLDESFSIGGFYKSEGAAYARIHKLKSAIENEYTSVSVPLSTDFPFPSPFSLLASTECTCNKARSLQPQKIIINSTQEMLMDAGHLLLKKPILSNNTFCANRFVADVPVWEPNPLWSECDPFELSLTTILLGLTKGKFLLYLIQHMNSFVCELEKKVAIRDLPCQKVETHYARTIYHYSMFLGCLLDFYFSYDFAKVINMLISTTTAERTPTPSSNELSAHHQITISKECIDSITSTLSAALEIAKALERDLFCCEATEEVYCPELQDDYWILEITAPARLYITTRMQPACDGITITDNYKGLLTKLVTKHTDTTLVSSRSVLCDLLIESATKMFATLTKKAFPILSTIQDAAELDYMISSHLNADPGSQNGTGMGAASMNESLSHTLITGSGFNGLIKAEVGEQTVSTSRLLGSGAIATQSGYNNVDFDQHLYQKMRYDYSRSWKDIVMRFRMTMVQCISTGQSYNPPSSAGIDCNILKKSILGPPGTHPFIRNKPLGQMMPMIQASAFRNRILSFFSTATDSAVLHKTIGLPYAILPRKFASPIMRRIPYEQRPERLYLHSALSTLCISANNSLHTFCTSGASQLNLDPSKFVHPSLWMYYSIHYIQESKYTLRFFGSNLFKNEPFDVDRIRASASLFNVKLASESRLYWSYICDFLSLSMGPSYKCLLHPSDSSFTRIKLENAKDKRQSDQASKSHEDTVILDYMQHNTEIPSIATSSYHAQSLHVVESDTHSLGTCMHNQESATAIAPAILQHNRLHIAADASYADCFNVSKVSGVMGMLSPSQSFYEHPALSPHRFLTELALSGSEADLFSSVISGTSVSSIQCFELLESFLITQNLELSELLLKFSLMHSLYIRELLPSETVLLGEDSFSGLSSYVLFHDFYLAMRDMMLYADKPVEPLPQTLEHTPSKSQRSLLKVRESSTCTNRESCVTAELTAELDMDQPQVIPSSSTSTTSGIFHPNIFMDKPTSNKHACLYYEPKTTEHQQYMMCGLDTLNTPLIPVSVITQILAIADYDENHGIDETMDSAGFCLGLHTIDVLAQALNTRQILAYNTTLLRFIASILRTLSGCINALSFRDYAAQLVFCNIVSLLISQYGLTHLAITLAEVTLGVYSSICDQPSSFYRKMRLASSIDAYLKEFGPSLGHADEYIYFVDLTQGRTRIPFFSTLFDADPTLVVEVSTGNVVVINLEIKSLLLVPFSVYITAKWFYMQLHAVIIRYARLLLKLDLADLTRVCTADNCDYGPMIRYISDYSSMITTLSTYLRDDHLQRLAIDNCADDASDQEGRQAALLLNPLAIMQHKYFLAAFKDPQMRLYVHVSIAVQTTNIRQVVASRREALKDFLLKHFFTRLTALTEQYIQYEKSFQLKTATTNYRNPLLKKPSIYTLATVGIDPKPLLHKGQLQATISSYQEASKHLTPDDNAYFEELRRSIDSSFATVFATDHSDEGFTLTSAPKPKQDALKDTPNRLFLSTIAPANELSLPLVDYLIMLDGLLLSIHATAPEINISHELLADLCLVSASGAVSLWTKHEQECTH